MTRLAVGDVQGCLEELRALLVRCDYRSDRDELWFVGDLVNRGPDSLGVLRFVRSLGDGATVVLGNHDLHLLAVALGDGRRALRRGDTLAPILAAPDREPLLEWLLTRPLAVGHTNAQGETDLMVHAGLLPQWGTGEVLQLASEVGRALQTDPRSVLDTMYGDEPDRWSPALSGADRQRVIINALTRLRYCRLDGRMDLTPKGAPGSQPADRLPWFDLPARRTSHTRVIIGHWSTLGLLRREHLLALDTGCVWGGALTAVSLDDPERLWQQPAARSRSPAA
ncbi:MAG: symmetrical bis(5'-nucleosyl)-tetraphosphatase [Steroidobacteraceae bacterium]